MRRYPDPIPVASLSPRGALPGVAGRSILAADDVTRPELFDLFRLAAQLESRQVSALGSLADRVVLTAFFEPSTRTRLSFETAVLRLGGMLLTISNTEGLSLAKGESLADTGVMLNNYADIVIVRHPVLHGLKEIQSGLRVPLINAGNATREHPTQAMADWYALAKWRPELLDDAVTPAHRVRIGILGSASRMRSVRSFLRLGLGCFARAIASVTIVSSDEEALDAALQDEFRRAAINVQVVRQADGVLHDFDVIYQNVIAPLHENERDPPRLTRSSPLKPEAVVLHPLARLDELAPELDDTPHNLYFSQAAGAVFVRQSLLLAIASRHPAEGG